MTRDRAFKCIVCETVCVGTRAAVHGKERKFCSPACYKKGKHAGVTATRAEARTNKTCVVCGALFTPKTNKAKYCSSQCRHGVIKVTINCIMCAVPFTPNRRGGLLCSTACKTARILQRIHLAALRKRSNKTCEVCGKKFTPKNARGKHCSSACNKLKKSRKDFVKRLAARANKTCEKCGNMFTPKTSTRKYCSASCKATGTVERRLRVTLRSRVRSALKHNRAGKAVEGLGCTIPELRVYLEARFKPGMTWYNWSKYGWHIDHIVPLAWFDLSDRAEFLMATHYTNLEPKWALDNLRKGARLEPPAP